MPQNVAFQTVLDALLDTSRPFPARYLHRFSDLPPAEVKAILQVWPKVTAQRKVALLEDLEELAEADTLTSFDDLARPLLADSQPQVRVLAMRLLWECEDPKLIPVYLDILNADEDPVVRAAAANALGLFVYLGEVENIPAELHRQVEDNLLEVATSEQEDQIRQRALESLGASSRDEVPPLIEAAYRRKDTAWEVSALYAMGRSADNRWEKQVLSNLTNPSDEVRSEAIRAAGELDLRASRTILLDMLVDEEDLVIRRQIIWALSKIGGEGVRNRLEELFEAEMDDDEADFLEEAIDNLAFNEDSGLFDLLDIEADNEEEEQQEEE
jgi:HEAT repeat protein